jgi:F-type H+-transporting ATPase subunit a
VYGQVSILAKETPHWWPPKVEDFILPGWFYPWITKFTVMVWIAVAVVLVFFLLGYRSPKIVPGRWQWMTESIYSFGRDGIGQDVIGHEGIRFAPYLVSLLTFIGVMNVFGIIPVFQVAPTAHIAIPAALTIVSYGVYVGLGIRRHGFLKFIKVMSVPAGVPWYILWLVAPLEFLSNFIIRPFTLSVRLFANMFAGHFILLVFTLGGFVLLNIGGAKFTPLSVVSWLLAIAITFLELLVALLQAYVFAILNAVYIQGSIAEEH